MWPPGCGAIWIRGGRGWFLGNRRRFFSNPPRQDSRLCNSALRSGVGAAAAVAGRQLAEATISGSGKMNRPLDIPKQIAALEAELRMMLELHIVPDEQGAALMERLRQLKAKVGEQGGVLSGAGTRRSEQSGRRAPVPSRRPRSPSAASSPPAPPPAPSRRVGRPFVS